MLDWIVVGINVLTKALLILMLCYNHNQFLCSFTLGESHIPLSQVRVERRQLNPEKNARNIAMDFSRMYVLYA